MNHRAGGMHPLVAVLGVPFAASFVVMALIGGLWSSPVTGHQVLIRATDAGRPTTALASSPFEVLDATSGSVVAHGGGLPASVALPLGTYRVCVVPPAGFSVAGGTASPSSGSGFGGIGEMARLQADPGAGASVASASETTTTNLAGRIVSGAQNALKGHPGATTVPTTAKTATTEPEAPTTSPTTSAGTTVPQPASPYVCGPAAQVGAGGGTITVEVTSGSAGTSSTATTVPSPATTEAPATPFPPVGQK